MAIGRSSIAHGAGPTSITLMTCVRPVRARSTGFSTRGRACGRSRWAWLCSPPTPAIRLGALLIDEGTVNGPRQLPRVRQAADPVKPELLRFMIGCRISNRRLPVWSEHSSPAASDLASGHLLAGLCNGSSPVSKLQQQSAATKAQPGGGGCYDSRLVRRKRRSTRPTPPLCKQVVSIRPMANSNNDLPRAQFVPNTPRNHGQG